MHVLSLLRRSVISPAIIFGLVVGLSAGDLELHFLNVGQGDCTLVVLPDGERILVDCGTSGGPFNATKVRNYIRNHLSTQDPDIDVLVITHPDADHYSKIPAVLGDATSTIVPVRQVVFVGSSSDYGTALMDEWLDEFPGAKTSITTQTFNTYPPKPLPGVTGTGVAVLAANVSASFSPSNARSIVLKVTNGTFDAMLCGDATRDTDNSILSNFSGHLGELDVEVWKAGHHGSWATATHTSVWADAIKPETVIYSASSTNTYGHPNLNLADAFKGFTRSAPTHTIRFWSSANTKATNAQNSPYKTEAMYLTATNGNIVIASNGATFTVKTNVPW